MRNRNDDGLGCLLFIGIGMATIGGCLLWGPAVLLVAGGIIIALAVAAAVLA